MEGPPNRSRWRRYLSLFLWGKKGKPPPNVIDYRAYHEQAVLVLGFLGAIMFAGLILVLQSSTFADRAHEEYEVLSLIVGPFVAHWFPEVLETLLACLVIISAVAVLASLYAVSFKMQNPRGPKFVFEFVEVCLTVVFLGNGQVVGLILLPFFPFGGFFVEVVFLLFYGAFAILFVWARKPRAPAEAQKAPEGH